ncbi:peptide/nickel transport system permease protein [Martelella mediterranea]|uniref:Peptide/nickel transport system permease protein n=2 Tax=Martelella mediterranea TaxID=293089 RepID=A0A4R3NWR9_9HYPH|nr:peptide/nickel transport system permease protein [Martelella mediterranea]
MVLFVLLRLLPGDPANALLSVGADPAQIEAARAQVGSNLPLWQQFLQFLSSLLRFDFGNSFVSDAPVTREVLNRLTVTLPLTFMAFVLAIIIAVPLGVISAVKSDRWYAAVITAVSQLGIAIPAFWMGILLVMVFAIQIRLFPSGGFPLRGWGAPLEALHTLFLPVLTIALVMAASLMRYVRASTLEVVGSDYLRTARALGDSFASAFWRHGIRNASIPVISILGIELGTAFLGAVVIEQVFSLPGLGSMLLMGIEQRDYPNVQGVLFISTLLVLVVGFIADVSQRLIDPRLRHSAGARS